MRPMIWQYNVIGKLNPTTMRRDRGHINTIMGGLAVEKESNNAKKAYAREIYNLHKQPTKKFRANQIISFSDEDYVRIITHHKDALVITASITDYTVSKILVDNGSLVDILYHHTLSRMDLQGMQMELCKDAPLYEFGNKLVDITVTIMLPIVVGQAPCKAKIDVKSMW